jgi:ketosteroid isomerase-like protein
MHSNADLVRKGYAAFNAADMQTLTELFTDTASWHTPGRSPLAGDNVGRDAIFAQFGRYMEGTGGTFKAELRYVTADDDGRVAACHHNSGQRNGRQLDVDCCITFQIENGQVVDGREHFYDLYAWDAFWS